MSGGAGVHGDMENFHEKILAKDRDPQYRP